VVCTEECEIHPSSDVWPAAEARLWDDRDIPALALMTEAVHEHGALAGLELTHNGASAANRYSREVPMGPSHERTMNYDPVQARAMDKQDIRDYRRWHKAAALRGRKAGFDIIYVYAAHELSIAMQFLQRRRNPRGDEYGGALENRARPLRELIEETKEAVGDTCAVAGREIVELLAELPDLWDVNISDWDNDSLTSRFGPEGNQEPYTAFVKSVTSKPVVGVGRFTSPDTMVSQIKRGVLDLIGAARPSIADPFLPRKIEEGRPEDIRECIGCNVCVSGDRTSAPMRCTQNPSVGEEWRKGWHPETVPPKGSDDAVLIVGAGPAGLEAARALGRRGYQVSLAEAGDELGGRVAREARLPGLAEWGRVRDYRVGQLDKMTNVAIYRASRLTAEHVHELAAPRVIVATGSHWRRDGVGLTLKAPVPGFDGASVYTPDDIMADTEPQGPRPEGPVLVYDDDHDYLGGVLAEKLRRDGLEVTLVTPALAASYWTEKTLEIGFIHKRLLELEVAILPNHSVAAFRGDRAELACVFTGRRRDLACASVVTVTARLPEEALYRALLERPEALAQAGINSVTAIGDALAPSTIAAAVYAGHRAARELDAPDRGDAVPFERELPLEA
jgi:dimethylamine/trimethylamine dehydrogenase